MVYVDDLKNFTDNTEPKRISDRSSLLKKYDIPLHYLDYDYVEKCTNGREIEKILHILRSGEEGYYPDLIVKTEEKLRRLKPHSKYLRQQTPVIKKSALDRDELNHINENITTFITEMEKNSEELRAVKGNPIFIEVPVRKSTSNIDNVAPTDQNPKRIASTDYASWDKYDVDTEILKMDIAEEKLKEQATTQTIDKPEKTVKFNEFRTFAEAIYESNREREKGNEYFKAGDYLDALRHYTNSLTCHSNIHAYNNRALVYIKLKMYEKAIKDCNMAIKLEPENVKSYIRKAQSLEALKRYKEALDSIEIAIETDPNNTTTQQFAATLRNTIGLKASRTKRLTIVEINDEESQQPSVSLNKIDVSSERHMEKKRPVKPILKNKMKKHSNNENYKLIPIAGTSNMKQPYYRIVNINNPIEVRNFYFELLNRPRVYYLNQIDNDEDDCLQIHIKPSKEKQIDAPKIKPAQGCKEQTNMTEQSEANDNKDILLKMKTCDIKSEEQLSKKSARKHTKHEVLIQHVKNDSGGSGEPTKSNEDTEISPENELHSPYTFLKTWNAISKDESYTKHAEVLRRLNMDRIPEVVGCKMDNKMFSIILNCLYRHFCVASELDKVYAALINLTNIPRFNIIAMLMSKDDKLCAKNLVKFLKQHGRNLPEDVAKKYE